MKIDRGKFLRDAGVAILGSLVSPNLLSHPADQEEMKEELQTLLTGLDIAEGPRWHEGRLWFCHWMRQEVVAVTPEGKAEVVLRTPFSTFPFSIDWLPDGTLVMVSSSDQPLLKMAPDGSLKPYADLSSTLTRNWNEIVIDSRGNAYINGGKSIFLVSPNGAVRKLVDGLNWPNGMIITPDNTKLVVAESFGKKLTGFDITPGGDLTNKRTWADLKEGVPDGLCLDANGNIWYADVPNKCCVLVKEGGEVLEKINLDRGGFACALGGKKGKTLFILSAQWEGFERIKDSKGTGQVQSLEVSSRGAGYPGSKSR